jgi:ribonuclease HI
VSNTSHITQTLKDKIERLESQGKKMQSYWIPGHCGIEVNERANLEAKQAIKEGRHSQLLLPVADLETQRKKQREASPNGTEENTLKGTTGMTRPRGSARSK